MGGGCGASGAAVQITDIAEKNSGFGGVSGIWPSAECPATSTNQIAAGRMSVLRGGFLGVIDNQDLDGEPLAFELEAQRGQVRTEVSDVTLEFTLS